MTTPPPPSWTPPEPGDVEEFMVAFTYWYDRTDLLVHAIRQAPQAWAAAKCHRGDPLLTRLIHESLRDGPWDSHLAAVVQALLEAGADINVQVVDADATPLFAAVDHDNTDAVRWLVRRGADPALRGRLGWTPMHLVQSAEIVRELVAHGAPVDARCRDGRTPLINAARHYASSARLLRSLLRHGADPRLVDDSGKSFVEHLGGVAGRKKGVTAVEGLISEMETRQANLRGALDRLKGDEDISVTIYLRSITPRLGHMYNADRLAVLRETLARFRAL